MPRTLRSVVAAAAVALATASAASAEAQAGAVDRWVRDLAAEDPFVSTRAQAELRRLGPTALPDLLPLLDAPDRRLRLEVEAIVDFLLESLLGELDGDYGALELDRRELAYLAARQAARSELAELRRVATSWGGAVAEIRRLAPSVRSITLLEAKEKALAPGTKLEAADAAELEKLREEVARAAAGTEDLEQKVKLVVRLEALERASESLAGPDEAEALRLQDLGERIETRRPRVDVLLKQLAGAGLAGHRALACRRERLPLDNNPADADARTPVIALYDRLLTEALDALGTSAPGAEPQLLGPDSDADSTRLEVSRYALSLLWALEEARGGPFRSAAKERMDRHIAATIADLAAADTALRDRARLELYRLGRRGLVALRGGGSSSPIGPREAAPDEFLAHLVEWRISPETYARTGFHFRDYAALPFAERRHRVYQYARVAGRDAIPTLRAIIADDALEPSFFVKHAAAKALATQLADHMGFVVLRARHPELVLKLPEVSRDILLIQGLAHIRARNYAAAVAELRKLVDEVPFDFEANYHLAFAYLLLKDYARAIHHFEIARRIQPKDQLALYNLACAYSLGSRPREALEALEAAIDAGFDDPKHMEADKDLDPVRNEPAFPRLIEKARNRGSAPSR